MLSNTFLQQHWQSRSRQGASRFAADPDPQHLSRPGSADAAAADQECQGTCPAAYDAQQLNLTRALPSSRNTINILHRALLQPCSAPGAAITLAEADQCLVLTSADPRQRRIATCSLPHYMLHPAVSKLGV